MCAVFRFWMYSKVLSFGVRIRFWDCRLPESWMGPNFCVATARPGPSAIPVAPSTQQMASRIRRFDIPPPSCGSPDTPEGRQRELFGYGFEDHLDGHSGPQTARRDVAQKGGEAHARVLDELDQRRDVGDAVAVAGEEGPVHGDPGEEARATARRGPCVPFAAAVRTGGRRVPHPARAALAARDAELPLAASVPEGSGDGPRGVGQVALGELRHPRHPLPSTSVACWAPV